MTAVERLLSGDTPRLFWTPGQTWTNDRFRSLVGAVPTALSDELDRSANAPDESLERPNRVLSGYVGCFVRVTGTDEGILAIFFPERSSLIASLPATLDDLCALSQAECDPMTYMRKIFDDGHGLFTTCCLLISNESGALLPLTQAGVDSPSQLRWPRYRFRQVQQKRTGAVLTSKDGYKAVVIPFSTYARERFVGVLDVREGPLDDAEWAFVKAIAARGPTMNVARREAPFTPASTSIRIATLPDTPYIVYFGPPASAGEGLADVFASRGWALENLRDLSDLLRIGRLRVQPSVVILAQPWSPLCAAAIRSIRTIPGLRRVAVLAIFDEPPEEIRLGSDLVLGTAASETAILDAVKKLLRLSVYRRRDAFDDALETLEHDLHIGLGRRQAAELSARWIAAHLARWVYVEAWNGDGTSTVAQPEVGPRLHHTPATFLEGFSTIQASLDGAFSRRITHDPLFEAALRAMQPVSGASLLLGFDGRIYGGIVCFAFDRRWDAPQVEALTRCSEIVSCALVPASPLHRTIGVS